MITIRINGKEVQVPSEKAGSLLRFLREDQGLTGTKKGCDGGECGTCTVLVDGVARRACRVSLETLEGASVRTVESLSGPQGYHPVQQALAESGAVQCGFCTPGLAMAITGLLEKDPDPSEEAIRNALKPNLCRCTGYAAVLRAVRQAAGWMREGDPPPPRTGGPGGVGESPVPRDVWDKVRGRTLFADDLSRPGMLWGKIVYARVPRARIRSVDVREARAVPGVVRVAVASDIPGENAFGILVREQPVLAGEEICYVGDPLAVVYAETPEAAEEGAKNVRADLEELPGVHSPEEAREAPEPAVRGKRTLSHTRVRRGDAQAGFAQAAVVREGEFSVPFVEHGYLEPESALSYYDEEGILTLESPGQGSYLYHQMICAMLGLPEEKVRVIGTPAGGGFGGKEEPICQLHSALGTWLTGAPVKITLTREESILASTKRHAETIRARLGAREDGTLVAGQARIDVDTGAYASLGGPVAFRSGVVAMGPYSIENVETDAVSYYTNNPVGGAMRGFGSTQVAFSSEVLLDMVRVELGMDPFEIRLKNALAPGRQTITGQTLDEGEAYPEALEAVREALAREETLRKPPAPGWSVGVGLAGAYKNVGLGIGLRDQAGAILELSAEGIGLYHGSAELGQGTSAVLSQIAQEASGIPWWVFRVRTNDTACCPDGEETTASRQTYISGNAVRIAAGEFGEKWNAFLRDELELDGDPVWEEGGIRTADGQSYPWARLAREAAQRGIPLRCGCEYAAPDTVPLPERHTPQPGEPPENYRIHAAYCFAAQAAIVAVEHATGKVRVEKIIAASDAGRAINPALVRGQIEGGVVMGMGYALGEELLLDRGRPLSTTLSRCGIPRITEAPEIEAIVVERATPEGPYGAKGMGELSLNPTAPAIANAIFDAVGYRAMRLPIRAEAIREWLAEQGEQAAGDPGPRKGDTGDGTR